MSEQGKPSRRKSAALRQADNDMKATLQSPAGRRVLMRLIDETGVFLRSFTGDTETFFREGRRSVGLDLIGAIERVDAGAFATLQQEALALRMQLEQLSQSGETDADEE
jgi:hypothetical protein